MFTAPLLKMVKNANKYNKILFIFFLNYIFIFIWTSMFIHKKDQRKPATVLQHLWTDGEFVVFLWNFYCGQHKWFYSLDKEKGKITINVWGEKAHTNIILKTFIFTCCTYLNFRKLLGSHIFLCPFRLICSYL